MPRLFSLLTSLALCLCVVTARGQALPAPELAVGDERRLGLNEGWRFCNGEAEGAEQPGFDDSAWRALDLPHDWAIEGPFDKAHGPSQGALPFYGTGWYRKHFTLPASAQGRHLAVELDGAMSNAQVWMNDVDPGGRPYGYIGFGIDLTPHLRPAGEENVLAVRRLPKVLGELVWTGFDYLGEPTPYYMWNEPDDPNDWPARSSYFGIVDLAGFPKDRYNLYQSRWTSEPMVHLLPHWSWEGHDGEDIPVMVYTNAEDVELFLNGESLGRKKRGAEPVTLPVGNNVNPEERVEALLIVGTARGRPGSIQIIARSSGLGSARTSLVTIVEPARGTR